MSLVSVLFVVVMLVGRGRWHPWLVLAVEAVIAAVLAFVPPLQWLLWFGMSGWSNTIVGASCSRSRWHGWAPWSFEASISCVMPTPPGPRSSDGGAEASDGSDKSSDVSST